MPAAIKAVCPHVQAPTPSSGMPVAQQPSEAIPSELAHSWTNVAHKLWRAPATRPMPVLPMASQTSMWAPKGFTRHDASPSQAPQERLRWPALHSRLLWQCAQASAWHMQQEAQPQKVGP